MRILVCCVYAQDADNNMKYIYEQIKRDGLNIFIKPHRIDIPKYKIRIEFRQANINKLAGYRAEYFYSDSLSVSDYLAYACKHEIDSIEELVELVKEQIK